MVDRYAAGDGKGEDGAGKAFVSLNWLLSEEPLDLETELAWGFLDYLLLGTSAAPLRKALNDSGLGEALIGAPLPCTGMQRTLKACLCTRRCARPSTTAASARRSSVRVPPLHRHAAHSEPLRLRRGSHRCAPLPRTGMQHTAEACLCTGRRRSPALHWWPAMVHVPFCALIVTRTPEELTSFEDWDCRADGVLGGEIGPPNTPVSWCLLLLIQGCSC